MLAVVANLDNIRSSMLIIVIEKENLERMKKSDPVTLETFNDGGILPPVKYPGRLQILVAYEENEDTIRDLVNSDGGLGELIEYLRRGFEFKEGIDGTPLVRISKLPKEG